MGRAVRLLTLIMGAALVAWACGGKSPSEPTPIPTTCAFTVSPSSLSVGASGGSGAVTVTTTASCAWTAASDHGWMAVDSGASGSGPGTVRVSLSANAGTAVRTATLTVAGQTVAVTQEGTAPAPCNVTVSPSSAEFSKDPATATFAVTAPASCAWSATPRDSWITVTSGAQGTGTMTVAYAISINHNLDARTGTIHVGDATFSILQRGDAGMCEFHVAPVVLNACMAVPYELSVNMSTSASCGWTVTSDTPWIALSGASSRTGSGEIRFRIGDNYDAPRLGVVKLRWDTPTAGQNVQVSQAGCRYGVSTHAMVVPSAGGALTFDVLQQSDPTECGGPLQNGCVWSAQSGASWITITSAMPKQGDDRVGFTVAPNTGPARSATITIRDQQVVISQDGR